MLKDYDIVGSYDNQRSTAFNAERTINMFEYIDQNAKKPKGLFYTSGIENSGLDFSPETGGSRATFVFNGLCYQVFGGSIYQISGIYPNLTKTIIGTLATSSGYVGIDANTFQLIFVDGHNGYIFDVLTNLFRQITDEAFPVKPIDVCYLDGFFVVINGDTNNFQLSSFNQGLIWGVGATASGATTKTVTSDFTAPNNWLILSTTANYQTGTPFFITSSASDPPAPLVNSPDAANAVYYYAIRVDDTHIRVATTAANAALGMAIVLTDNGSGDLTIENNGQLQEASVTTHPGTLVACKTLHRRLFLFSQFFTEVWENAGEGTNLPFRRNNTLLMELGTPAIGSVVVGFDMMFFLSQDRGGLSSVMGVKGSESVPSSNRALDFQLSQYASENTLGISHVSDARGILVKENGLIFYRLNFTLSNHTFVLNVTMSDPTMPRWHEEEVLNGDRHPAQTQGYFHGNNFYASYKEPIFYHVNNALSTNDGESIRRARIGRMFVPEGYNRTRIDRFQLDLLQGHSNQDIIFDVPIQTESNLDLLTESGEEIVLNSGEVVDLGQPVVFLSISKDGGQSYGYADAAPMGKIGERSFRTVWRKKGTIPRGQAFMPKIEFYNRIPFIILGAAWSYETMPE